MIYKKIYQKVQRGPSLFLHFLQLENDCIIDNVGICGKFFNTLITF